MCSKSFPKKYKRTFWGIRFTSSGHSTEWQGPSHGTHGAPRVSRAPLKAKQRDEAGRASLLHTLCEFQGTTHVLCLGATGVPLGCHSCGPSCQNIQHTCPSSGLGRTLGASVTPGGLSVHFRHCCPTGMPLPGCGPASFIKGTVSLTSLLSL